MAGHFVGLSTSTKVLYSLFNFFTPICLVYLVIGNISKHTGFSITTSIVAFCSFLVGLFCLITHLIKYNKFLIITEDFILICSGNKNNPKVLDRIKRDTIQPDSLSLAFNISLKHQGKKIELLHTSVSFIAFISCAGPMIFIPLLHYISLKLQKYSEIVKLVPMLTSKKAKTTKYDGIIYNIFNVITWVFVGIISFLGFIGLILIPFYPFIGANS